MAYHGTTMGALSVNGLTGARAPFGPLVPGARHAPMSHRYRCPYCKDAPACTLMCYDEIERLVEFEGPEQVAAIITEPVQNAGGCIPPGSMDYFKKIRKLCDETGILMIMDEVICGFGRLGELFGSTYFGVEPDLITRPRGSPRRTRRSARSWSASRSPTPSIRRRPAASLHGLTFGGHPVSCAAALANLDIILEEDLPGQAKATGAYLRGELEAAFANHPNVGDIRGAGLFLGVELVADKATKQPPGGPGAARLADRPDAARGLILRNDDRNDPTTQLCPPLVITREEVDRVVAILVESLDELGKRLGTIGTVHAQIVSYPNPA